jgi:hypothetical protein
VYFAFGIDARFIADTGILNGSGEAGILRFDDGGASGLFAE